MTQPSEESIRTTQGADRCGHRESEDDMSAWTGDTDPKPIDWQARATAAKAENAKLRDALEFYANGIGATEIDDQGSVARAALQETTDVG